MPKAYNEMQEASHDWSSLTISVFTGRDEGLLDTVSRLRHGPKAFALLQIALMRLFASFFETFELDSVVNRLCVTEVVSENPAYSHISLLCDRLTEAEDEELLARFVKLSQLLHRGYQRETHDA